MGTMKTRGPVRQLGIVALLSLLEDELRSRQDDADVGITSETAGDTDRTFDRGQAFAYGEARRVLTRAIRAARLEQRQAISHRRPKP